MCRCIERKVCRDFLLELNRPVVSMFDWSRVKLAAGPSVRLLSDLRYAEPDGVSFDTFTTIVSKISLCTGDVEEDMSSIPQHYGPNLAHIVQHRWFEYCVDFMIFVNAIAIVCEAELKVTTQKSVFVTWEEGMPLFTLMYVIEMVLKMYGYGCKRYFKEPRNVFDFVVTWIISCGEIFILVTRSQSDWSVVRLLLVLRFLRCLRLMVALERLNNIFAIFIRLIPAFTTLYGMLGAVMAVYGAVGVSLFGGKIYVGNPNLNNTDFHTSNYYALNFNDFASAMVTLFQLLVVNNVRLVKYCIV